jgi:hypothetical protein
MKHNNVRRFLDKHYRRVIQHSSANWGGNNVWNVKSDGQTEGRFIFEDDNNNFILLDRTEENEETQITDLFIYQIGSGKIKKLINNENNNN